MVRLGKHKLRVDDPSIVNVGIQSCIEEIGLASAPKELSKPLVYAQSHSHTVC